MSYLIKYVNTADPKFIRYRVDNGWYASRAQAARFGTAREARRHLVRWLRSAHGCCWRADFTVEKV